MRRALLGALIALTLTGCIPNVTPGPAVTGPRGGCKTYYADAPPPVVDEAIFEAFGYLGQTVVNQAGRVACCESGWGPAAANPSSDARGLFQLELRYNGSTIRFYSQMRGYPPGVTAWADPWVNAMTARDVWLESHSWRAWVCQP